MFIFIFIFLFFSIKTFSDQKLFVWTYQPMIEAPGEYEMEIYNTLKEPDKKDNQKNIWETQLEIEAGISKKFDLSFYQVFEEKEKFSLKGFKLRGRFMPYERGKKVVDFVLYLEYFKNKNFDLEDKIEGKLIFGKKYKDFEWAFNITGEYKTSPKNEWEYILNFALTKEFFKNFYFGFESFAIFEKGEKSYYLGPTFSIGEHQLWFTYNLSFGLNDESDDLRHRLIFGINLN